MKEERMSEKNAANDVDLVCCLFCIRLHVCRDDFELPNCVYNICINGKQYRQCGLKTFGFINRLPDFHILVLCCFFFPFLFHFWPHTPRFYSFYFRSLFFCLSFCKSLSLLHMQHSKYLLADNGLCECNMINL